MSGDHDHIDCCTPECATVSAGSAIPSGRAELGFPMAIRMSTTPDREASPLSVAPEALDPPPRVRLT